MSVLKRTLLRVSRHVPTDVLRHGGRWMLRGSRRRAVREHLARSLTQDARTIDRGVGAGIRLSATGSNPAYAMGLAEPAVQAELEQWLQPGMVFYDVGANIGFLTLIASRLVGAEGQVVAFEPLPDNAALLERNITLNKVTNVLIVRRALSSRSGRARMTVPGGSDAGTRASLDSSADAAGPEVLVSALDEITEMRLRPPDLVKIDVEGAEADVVAGMQQTLHTAGPRLLIEIHDDREDRWREQLIRRVLEPLGYRLDHLGAESAGMPHLLAVAPSR